MAHIKFEDPELTGFNHGFQNILKLNNTEKYEGKAAFVILVWHEYQLIPAEEYRKYHHSHHTVDLVVCEDPNFQKAVLKDKSIIYHFS
jgi:hypothetical protein